MAFPTTAARVASEWVEAVPRAVVPDKESNSQPATPAALLSFLPTHAALAFHQLWVYPNVSIPPMD